MSTEDARVVRALVIGGAVGLTFWAAVYSVARAVIDKLDRR